MPRLTIDRNTTLQDVSAYLRQADTGELLAKRKNGDIVLYTREQSGASAFFKNLSDRLRHRDDNPSKWNRLEEKRTLAKETLNSLIQSYGKAQITGMEAQLDAGPFGKKSVATLKSFYGDVWKTLPTITATPDTLDRAVSALMAMTDDISATISARQDRFPRMEPFGPTTNAELPQKTECKYKGDGSKRQLPHLMIGGREMVPASIIGKTAAGMVVARYEDANGKALAVKLNPILSPTDVAASPDVNEATLLELNNSRAMSAKNPNAIGFNDFVPLANGAYALVSELATNGGLNDMARKLQAMTSQGPDIPSGMISQEDRKLVALTLINDAAIGLLNISRKGMLHADVKSQNIVIDKDGVGKLIDFGGSVSKSATSLGAVTLADNFRYRGPEWQPDIKAERQRVKDGGTWFAACATEFLEAFHLDGRGERLGTAISQDLAEGLHVLAGKAMLKSTYDMFGLGTAAYELFTGTAVTDELEVPNKMELDKEKDLLAWAQRGAEAIGKQNGSGLTSLGSGDAKIDKLLNKMLKSNPDDRITFSRLRNDPIMTESKGLMQSDEVRRLIKAIASEDPAQIDAARTDLTNAREKLAKAKSP